ncbi:MAG: hypothetical protein Unbinned5374contig1001_33 [Prokaryotic dsDNA virus sp.]|nr:MAG: hypothetical protein Unbinned5374contig1001_33 [Prokaryotic dsDNA virus sp.]|tara:strand:- start:282 stop:476 length:195 start_codon:yes stop_codon:yes gene_type:complete
MKVNSDDFKFILQTLNRIDSKADVEFNGNHWDDAKDRTYKSLESISIEFPKEKNDNAKLIIKIS